MEIGGQCKTCDANAAETASCAAGSTSDVVTCACNAGKTWTHKPLYINIPSGFRVCLNPKLSVQALNCLWPRYTISVLVSSTANSHRISLIFLGAGFYGDGTACTPVRDLFSLPMSLSPLRSHASFPQVSSALGQIVLHAVHHLFVFVFLCHSGHSSITT